VTIALEVIQRSFPQLLRSEDGSGKIQELIPIFGQDVKSAASAESFQIKSQQARELLELTTDFRSV
jgi:hypothetical protein